MMDKEELNAVLSRHTAWLKGEAGGERADLNGTNLAEANLNGTNLAGADLRGASLTRADLVAADLGTANLCGANLARANLTGANLTRANLSRVDLYGANLTGVDLYGANLTEARGIAFCGPIGSSRRTVIAVDHGDTDPAVIHAGCWSGTVDELRARIAPDGGHGWSADVEATNRAAYETAIAFLVATIEGQRGNQ